MLGQSQLLRPQRWLSYMCACSPDARGQASVLGFPCKPILCVSILWTLHWARLWIKGMYPPKLLS